MVPDQLAKSGTEHAHQRALFAYCAVARLYGFESADLWAGNGAALGDLSGAPVDALEWIHAIHNQGHGDRIRGARAKAEGVKAGVADIFLPWPVKVTEVKKSFGDVEYVRYIQWCGLYIEMKKPSVKPKKEGSKGGLSNDQLVFAEYAKNNNYGWCVCYSWREAANIIRKYIEWE